MINRTRKLALAVMLAVTGLLATTACSEIAPPDEVGLYYLRGPVDGDHFDHCFDPGKTTSWRWNNGIILLPNNLRTWNIAAEGGDTAVPITVASKPEKDQPSGVQVNVWSQTNLMLNTDCRAGKDSPLVQFWERIGRRYEANTVEGWRIMLLNTVVPALEKAKRTAVREYGADALVAGTVLAEVQSKVSAQFAIELKRLTGGDYFCGPSFDRVNHPDVCPPVEIIIKDVDYADPGIQEARNAKQKALEQATALVAEAEGKLAAAAAQNQLYGNAAWVQLELARLELEKVKACAANPNCTIIVGASGSTIINTK